MLQTLSAFWQFLKKPHLLKLVNDRGMLRKGLFWLLILDFAFAGMVGLVYWLLLKFKLIIKYEEFDFFQYGFGVAMILGAIVAPVLEEFVFRWQLRSRNLVFGLYWYPWRFSLAHLQVMNMLSFLPSFPVLSVVLWSFRLSRS
jgi:hypothetical protein